jgi:predicted ATP-grasp superfamily ATP-dependent carboligase
VRDGVGCEQCFVCHDEDYFNKLLINLTHHEHYIIQPFINGIALSISVLFNKGVGQLLCINEQLIITHEQQFKLIGCNVNIDLNTMPFQTLVDKIAIAFPELWGYAGIDLIQQNKQLFVVEINPRLTSSYTGIREALGINVAELILQFLNGEMKLLPTKNQIIHIDLA